MSIFIQEVLGLLKRNKRKTTLERDRDYFEFGKLGTTSRINTSASYIAQMEPFTIKYQDFFCDLRQDLTVTVAGSGVEGKIPVYTVKDAICSLDALKDSIITQDAQNALITISGGLTVDKNAILKESIDLGTSGDVVHATSLYNRILDSAGAEAGAANRILISQADGRVVWSDDDPSGVNGSGTVNHIAMWKTTTGIGNADPVPMIQSGTGASATLTIGDGNDQAIVTDGILYVNGPLKDSGGNLGTAGQILRGDSSSQLIWTSTMIAGLNFNDDVKLTFGDVGVPGDLEIFHNAANSVIKDTGTGSLMIQGSNLILQSSLTKNAIICGDSDSVDIFYNGVLKLQTANTGIKITGGILDVNDQLGTAGQILSSTGTTLDWIDAATGTGTVTSVGLQTGGDAFVDGSAVTTSGNVSFTMAGDATQYINGAGNLATLTSIETDTLQSVTTRGASSSVATNFTGSLTVNGSNAGAYFYVSGNAQSTTPPTTYNTGMAMVWNNSGGSRENEMYYASGAGATQAENDASYFAFINRFNTAGTPVDQTTLKLYGDGNLELTGPASTSTIANAYWRMPKVAAPNTGYILAKSSGSINLEWIQANTYNNNISGVPSTATSTGSAGSIRFDENYIYVCYATNSWRRVAVATW